MENEDILFEPEYTPDEPQTDAIWVRNEEGELVRQEVADDAEDN